MKRSAILACLLALVLGGGCGHDDDPFFDVHVTMINNGAPVQADVCILDDSVFPPVCGASEDFVPVRMVNKTRSDVVITDPNSFLHDFHLQRYAVTWRRVDGGPSSGTDPITGAPWNIADYDFVAGTSVVVPVGSFADFAIMVSPAGMKFGEPFSSASQVLLVADIDFVGTRGITSDVEIHVPVSLSVNFADYEDL